MIGLRICIAIGLLTCLSGTSVASQGVVSFQGAIVEFPCRASVSNKSVTVQDCPTMAAGTLISNEPKPSVRSIKGPKAFVKNISENAETVPTRQYLLADSKGMAIESGDYVMTLAYP